MTVYTAAQIYRFARRAGFTPDESVTMTAVALAESGGDSRARNSSGEDSRGLWQINMDAHSSWAASLNLYDPADNARAAYKVSRGGEDISPWTVTHGGNDARYVAYRAEAQRAAVMNGDPPDLGVWSGTSGYGHALAAGGDSGDDETRLDVFLEAALAQTGDEYIFGAPPTRGDDDPDAFDCSELVLWAADQAGVHMPDGSWQQYLELKKQGAIIPVEEAIDTPGALLFSFSVEPTPGGPRPSSAHVAISLGDGKTIEARGRAYGVGSWEANEQRFQYAAVIPELMEAAPALQQDSEEEAAAVGYEDGTDSDADQLIDQFEIDHGLDPTSPDSDDDDLSDYYELTVTGTDPTKSDSDGDGLSDSIELAMGLDPLDPDSNRDGRLDGSEGTPDGAADQDGDLLSDELEEVLGLDPTRADSDGDGITDGGEYFAEYDPLDAASAPTMFDPDADSSGPDLDVVMAADDDV